MMVFVPKTTSINLRITPDFRAEIEALAAYHGLTMSSYAHSVLVKAIRRERQELNGVLPNASQSERRVHEKNPAPIVGRIAPGKPAQSQAEMTRDEVRDRFIGDSEIAE